MSRKNILFITKVSLDNPVRGTPLRIYNFIRQISKENNVLVCAEAKDAGLDNIFFAFPNLGWLGKIKYFRKIIRDNNIEVLVTATATSIKLLVLLKLICRVKIVTDLHGIDYWESYDHGYINRWQRILKGVELRFYLNFFDLLFTVSGKLKKFYRNIWTRSEVIYGGVNMSEFPLPENQRPHSNHLVIGYMGNARFYQGLDIIIDSAKQIKQKKLFPFKLNLVVSGGPDVVEEVRQMLQQADLSQEAELQFNIPHDQVNQIIGQSDVLVLPRPAGIMMSEYAFPSKLPEYLVTGIVTVTSDVGPVSELLAGKDVCLIIEINEPVQNLSACLEKVYRMNPMERAAMGQRARDFVEQNLSWDILGKKINNYLASL